MEVQHDKRLSTQLRTNQVELGLDRLHSHSNGISQELFTVNSREVIPLPKALSQNNFVPPGFKSGKVSPSDSRPQTANSYTRKSAWDRAQEKFEAQEKQQKGTKVRPFIADQTVLAERMCCNLHTFLDIFRSKQFKTPKIERLYQRYFFKLNQNNLTVLLGLLCIICVMLIVCYYVNGATLPVRGVILGVVIVIFISMEVLCNRSAFDQLQMSVHCYVVIGLLGVIVMVITLDCDPHSASDGVWCTLFFVYMVYTLLPVRMRIAVGTGLLISVMHTICTGGRNYEDTFVWKQVNIDL